MKSEEIWEIFILKAFHDWKIFYRIAKEEKNMCYSFWWKNEIVPNFALVFSWELGKGEMYITWKNTLVFVGSNSEGCSAYTCWLFTINIVYIIKIWAKVLFVNIKLNTVLNLCSFGEKSFSHHDQLCLNSKIGFLVYMSVKYMDF